MANGNETTTKLKLLKQEADEHNNKLESDLKNFQITHEDLRKVQSEPREEVISPILCKGGLMMVQGETGVGKSYFMTNLAYALATGGNFLKYKIPKAQKIIYVDGEMGLNDMHWYVAKIPKNENEDIFPENLRYFCYDQFPNKEIYKFSDPIVRDKYTKYMVDNDIDGIIIDNLATTMDIDENNPKDWKPIQSWFLRLRALGKFVIFVHHAGADKTKDRGITARKDVLNTVISLQKIPSPDSTDHRMKIVYQKHRHFFGKDSLSFEAVHKTDGTWNYQDIEVSNYEQVIAYFLIGTSGIQIAEKLNIVPSLVSKYKKRAIDEGKLSTYPNGRLKLD